MLCSTRWGTYYGLWRCWGPVTSPKMAAILDTILDFTQSYTLSKKGKSWHYFDAKHVEHETIKHFASFVNILCFYHLKRVKNTQFYPKMAWPAPTDDVISRNHSNWFSTNLCQNVCKGYAYSYWKTVGADEKSPWKNWRKPYFISLTNRFHVAVRLFSNRS